MSVCRRCDQCQELREFPSLKHKLSIRGRDGKVTYVDICSDECLADWAEDRIEERAARRAAAPVAAAAGGAPTPLVMPPRSVPA